MSARIRPDMTPDEIRAAAQAWYDRQMTVLAQAHGSWWPAHREWVSEYLKAQLRERVEALGWRSKHERN